MEMRKAAAVIRCSELISQIDEPYRMCTAVIDHLHRSLNYRRSAVILRTRNSRKPVVFVHCQGGMSAAEHRAEVTRVDAVLERLERGLVVAAIQGHQPRVSNDVSRSGDYVLVDPAVRSEACFPLMLNDHCLGVINAESFETDTFDPDDYVLLHALSTQLALHLGQSRPQDRFDFLQA